MNPNPQEYTIKDFQVGDFKDPNGNTWCNVGFEEMHSEPIRWVVKDPATVVLGSKVYGHIEVKTSQAGKPYNRFYRDQRPDYTYSGIPGAVPGNMAPPNAKYPPRDDNTQESIARSVALKAAVDVLASEDIGTKAPSTVLKTADIFLAWLQNSGSQGTGQQPAQPSSNIVTNEAENPQPAAATSAPARPWDRVGQGTTVDNQPDPNQPIYNRAANNEPWPDVPPEYQ